MKYHDWIYKLPIEEQKYWMNFYDRKSKEFKKEVKERTIKSKSTRITCKGFW